MDNPTCDICGYCHPKPDDSGIVILCGDGLYRCKVCRGAGKYEPKPWREEPEEERVEWFEWMGRHV